MKRLRRYLLEPDQYPIPNLILTAPGSPELGVFLTPGCICLPDTLSLRGLLIDVSLDVMAISREAPTAAAGRSRP